MSQLSVGIKEASTKGSFTADNCGFVPHSVSLTSVILIPLILQ